MKAFVGFTILFVIALIVCSSCMAETIDLGIGKWELPEAQAGAIISFKTEGIETCLTTKLIAKEFTWGNISLNAGAAPAINEPIVSLTYQLPKDAMSKWDVQIPYADLFDIQAGFYIGFEMNEYSNDPDDSFAGAIDYGAAIIGASISF